MKKILIAIILIVFLPVFAFACSKADPENTEEVAEELHPELGNVWEKMRKQIKEETEFLKMLTWLLPQNMVPAEQEQDDLSNFTKMDYDDMEQYITDFWTQNKGILETVASEMKDQGIEKVSISALSVTVAYRDQHISYSVEGSEAMKATVDLCKEGPLTNSEFGWKSSYDPLFTNHSEYFCFTTSIFYDDHHNVYSMRLVYSHNSIEDLKEYTDYVQLAPEWLLIVNWYE